jgi:hypothetical protein
MYNFDESLPAEKTTLIVFAASDFVWKSYNGINVDWPTRKDSFAIFGAFDEILLPAGETQLIFDLTFFRSDTQYHLYVAGKDLELHYNFEAQKRYLIVYPGSGDCVRIHILKPGERIKNSVFSFGEGEHDLVKIGNIIK